MERPPDIHIPRHDVMTITCLACNRRVEFRGDCNSLVGCHERMKCTACGHRGALLSRGWDYGEAPKENARP